MLEKNTRSFSPSSPEVIRPDFPNRMPVTLFIGPQRTATSWLYRYFKARGDICMSEAVKELFFFDRYYDRGVSYYQSHFHPAAHHRQMVDITTTAFAEMEAPQRVYCHFGADIRLVCPLRHPVLRSYSLYRHLTRYGMVNVPLEDAILRFPEIIHTSRYTDHLERWVRVFGRDRIFVCFQEDLRDGRDDFLRNLCDFMEVPFVPVGNDLAGYCNAAVTPPNRALAALGHQSAQFLRRYKLYAVINAAKNIGVRRLVFGDDAQPASPPRMTRGEYDILAHYLVDEIAKVEKFLGYSIPAWHRDIAPDEGGLEDQAALTVNMRRRAGLSFSRSGGLSWVFSSLFLRWRRS